MRAVLRALIGCVLLAGTVGCANEPQAPTRATTAVDAELARNTLPDGSKVQYQVFVDDLDGEVIVHVARPASDVALRLAAEDGFGAVWHQIAGTFDTVVVRTGTRVVKASYADLARRFGDRDSLDRAPAPGDGAAATANHGGDCRAVDDWRSEVCNRPPDLLAEDKVRRAVEQVCPHLIAYQLTPATTDLSGTSTLVTYLVGHAVDYEPFMDMVFVSWLYDQAAFNMTCEGSEGPRWFDLATLVEVPNPLGAAPAVEQPEPEPVPAPELTPVPAGPSVGKGDRDTWDDPALYAMDCATSFDPEVVEVTAVASGDVTGDGVADTVVAARCVAATSPWPDEVALFDPATGRSWTLLSADDPVGMPSVTALSINGGRVLLEAAGRSPTAPFCCPDQQLTGEYVLEGDAIVEVAREVTDL